MDYTFYRGRVGLYVLLKALGVTGGDEVATQAFTCLAVPEGIMAAGAKPVYVDLAHNSVNMDVADLREKINVKTKAIIVQHTFGVPADMGPIVELAHERGIPIVEDCCHTLISKYGGNEVGSFGAAAFYSFEWGKPVVCGIGGACKITDESLRNRLAHISSCMRRPSIVTSVKVWGQYAVFKMLYAPQRYWLLKKAFRRLSGLGAVEGNYNSVGEGVEIADDFSQLMVASSEQRLKKAMNRVDAVAEYSGKICTLYEAGLKDNHCEEVDVPNNAEPVYSRYPIWCDNKIDVLREAEKKNIEVADWYMTPIHPLSGSDLKKVNYTQGSCPEAERACGRIISLPTHEAVNLKYVDKVIQFLKSI
jgi:perosamine synthetase